MNEKPKVAVILINYNGFDDTVDCVRSLRNINYSNYEIIIVENASNDCDRVLNDAFLNANTTIIVSENNNGFSDGNNQGIKLALEHNAQYVVLLNNDTVVEPDFLDELIKTANNHIDAGIITGDIYYYSNPQTLWYSNGSFNTDTCITRMVQRTEKVEEKVTFVCGCLMLIPSEVIKKVGMLDDSFFLYSEDTEYCCRMLRKGYQLYWTNKSKIYHKVSASTGENSDFQQYYLLRNNLLMIRLYSTNKPLSIMKRFYQCLKNVIRRRASIWCYLDAIKDNSKRIYGRSKKY